ncbi:hypothetical protein V6N12_045990 [Hibiscus sabdariffa]|uniref:glutathione transferase n=1 Tax=Hibiscus sabdariffa TaxID=183260 RepID=A0ABR2G4A8_9ROSI
MAEEVKLFKTWSTPFGLRVVWALKLKGIEYESIDEDLSNKSDLLLHYNPVYKKVPVLVHNGKPISESTVILEYIDDTWKQNPILPQDPVERARERFWAKFNEEKLLPTIWAIFTTEGKDLEEAMAAWGENLKFVEEELKGKKVFGGEKIGLADLVFGWLANLIGIFEESPSSPVSLDVQPVANKGRGQETKDVVWEVSQHVSSIVVDVLVLEARAITSSPTNQGLNQEKQTVIQNTTNKRLTASSLNGATPGSRFAILLYEEIHEDSNPSQEVNASITRGNGSSSTRDKVTEGAHAETSKQGAKPGYRKRNLERKMGLNEGAIEGVLSWKKKREGIGSSKPPLAELVEVLTSELDQSKSGIMQHGENS